LGGVIPITRAVLAALPEVVVRCLHFTGALGTLHIPAKGLFGLAIQLKAGVAHYVSRRIDFDNVV
jgi:hypothetical protein